MSSSNPSRAWTDPRVVPAASRGRFAHREAWAADTCRRSGANRLDAAHGESLCLDLACMDVDAWRVATFASGESVANRYVVVEPLGRGGMGKVYSAHDSIADEVVALKVPLPSLCDDPTAIARLWREVALGRRVAHPHVCRVHDVGVHEREHETLYFASMQLIAGERLSSVIRRRDLEPHEAIDLARQMLCGLQAIHDADVLHRDVKSDNVMVSHAEKAPRAIITDFGLSQCLRAPASATGSPTSGSLAYMAPEQLRGGRLSLRTDLFAFGVVLFEMLTGVRPFPDVEAPAREAARRPRRSAARPSEIRPDLDRSLDEVVLRCLQEDPRARYASARDVIEALERRVASGVRCRP